MENNQDDDAWDEEGKNEVEEDDGSNANPDLDNPGEPPNEETESKPEANENGTSPEQKSPATTLEAEPKATSTIGQDSNAAAPDQQETGKESNQNKNDVPLASPSAPAAEAMKMPDGAGNFEESTLVALWFGSKFPNLF